MIDFDPKISIQNIILTTSLESWKRLRNIIFKKQFEVLDMFDAMFILVHVSNV